MAEQKLKKQIFYAEDDLDTRSAVTELFNENQLFVVGAAQCSEARLKLKNQKFDCILLDMKLEQGLGAQVLEVMRSDKAHINFDTPVIVVSGQLDQDLVMRIRKHVSDILVKPVEPEALLNKVQAMIKSQP